VGVLTKLPIGLVVLNKHCRVGTASNNPGDHDCLANFEGSSGAMESAALVQVAHGLLDESHVLFGTIAITKVIVFFARTGLFHVPLLLDSWPSFCKLPTAASKVFWFHHVRSSIHA
jgi:hypothetical protein